jgi:hypothetical protein
VKQAKKNPGGPSAAPKQSTTYQRQKIQQTKLHRAASKRPPTIHATGENIRLQNNSNTNHSNNRERDNNCKEAANKPAYSSNKLTNNPVIKSMA